MPATAKRPSGTSDTSTMGTTNQPPALQKNEGNAHTNNEEPLLDLSQPATTFASDAPPARPPRRGSLTARLQDAMSLSLFEDEEDLL
tara:strand:+ start:419 stop:679 length:261 start_codon:yes stop_codon:yes gene_type:complete